MNGSTQTTLRSRNVQPPDFDDLDLDAYADVPYEIEFIDGPPRGKILREDHRITTVEVRVTTHVHGEDGRVSTPEPYTLLYRVFPHAVGYTDEDGVVCVFAWGATDEDACQRHIDAVRLRQEADFLDDLNGADVVQ